MLRLGALLLCALVVHGDGGSVVCGDCGDCDCSPLAKQVEFLEHGVAHKLNDIKRACDEHHKCKIVHVHAGDDDDDSDSSPTCGTNDCSVSRRCPNLVKNDPDQYIGLGSDGGYDGSRRSKNNIDIDSTTITSTGAYEWRFDVANAFPEISLGPVVLSRIVGTLATPQVTDDKVYLQVASGWTAEDGSFAAPSSKIIALDAGDGSIAWVADYARTSTEAQKKLVAKYPAEYDATEFAKWLQPSGSLWSDPVRGGRDASRLQGSFGPISIVGDYLLTGDSSTNSELRSTQYLATVEQGEVPCSCVVRNCSTPDVCDAGDPVLPQYTLAPVLGYNQGLDTNRYRHLLRNTIMVLDRHTGDVVAVDRYADAGEVRASGVVQVNVALRMATPYVDPVDCQTYVVAGTSITTGSQYTALDTNLGRAIIGDSLCNMDTERGGRMTRWRLERDEHTNKVIDLVEVNRFYPTPEFLKAGDFNPATGGRLADNCEANRYNYHFDGIWMQRPSIDFDRRQVCVGTGNGQSMPVEDIALARSAKIATSPKSHPEWPYSQWTLYINNAENAADMHARLDELRATNQDRLRALESRNPLLNDGETVWPRTQAQVDRYNRYFSSSIVCLSLDTFDIRWAFRRNPLDTWSGFQRGYTIPLYGGIVDETNVDQIPNWARWQLSGVGGDLDYGMGPLMVQRANLNVYIAAGKDGSLQALDPETGHVLWFTYVATPAFAGALNYGATIVDDHVYVSALNLDGFTGIGLLQLESNAPPPLDGEPIITLVQPSYVSSGIDAAPFSLLEKAIGYIGILANAFTRTQWFSTTWHDSFDEYTQCASKTEQCAGEVTVYEGQSYLSKVSLHTGRIVSQAPIHPLHPEHRGVKGEKDILALIYGTDGIYDASPINVALTSVGDVVLHPGGNSGQLFARAADDTLRVLWSFDARADLNPVFNQTSLPPFVGAVQAVSPVVAAGNALYAGVGEVSIFGTTPGKYFYKFSVDK